MANARSRSVSYTPRMQQWEAFDLCSPELREALANAVTLFDTYAMLRYERKHGTSAALRWVRQGNRAEAQRYWIKPRGIPGSKGFVPGVPNPCVTLGLRPLVEA